MFDGAKIFIENSPGIGDLIMLTPVLRAIKDKYPNAELTVASWGGGLSTVERLPYIDHIHHIEPSFSGRLKSFNCIRKMDYVIFNSYQATLAQFARLCRVKKRGGNCKDKHLGTSLFTHPFPYTNIASVDYYETDYAAKKIGTVLEENLEISDYQCDVSSPTDFERACLERKLKYAGFHSDNYVVFSPFGNTSLALRKETIKEVIEILLSKGRNVVLMGRKKDNMLNCVLEEIASDCVFDLTDKTTLMEMIALIEGAEFNVMLDSGPLHISCALGRKTAGIYTCINPYEWKPKNNCYAISHYLECTRPCYGSEKCDTHACNDFSEQFIKNELEKFISEYILR